MSSHNDSTNKKYLELGYKGDYYHNMVVHIVNKKKKKKVIIL